MHTVTNLSSKLTAAVTAFALSLVMIAGTVTVPTSANSAVTYVSVVA